MLQAEFAALAPSAGSAYAYTRATMGQFLAFMLGWDLVLEYTVAGTRTQDKQWAPSEGKGTRSWGRQLR